jgi:predicted metal-binding protein
MTRERTPLKQAGLKKIIGKYVRRACELGADDARIIDASTVVTASWVRMKCHFGCELYGLGYCCPPQTPTSQEMREVIACYEHALLFHCTRLGGPSSIAYELEREIFLSGFYKALGLGSGPCRICRKCSPTECKHADRARPSMEACGIDVFATVRANGYTIEVLRDESCEGNYFGLVLID